MAFDKIPKHEQVKDIMNEVYNGFYLKWRNELTQENKDVMMQEAYALDKKYDCKLCRQLTINLINCIEDQYREREGIK